MHIMFTIPGMGFGGAERVVSILANELVKDHDVTIFLTSGNSKCVYALNEKIRLVSTPPESGLLKNWLSFRKECKKLQPDVVLAFMMGQGILTSIMLFGTGIPVITSERNDPKGQDQVLNFKWKLLEKIAHCITKYYVFQSEGAKVCYPKRVQKKSCIILNPLDTEHLSERNADQVDNRIVSVGRLTPQKNQKMLIEAFSKAKMQETHTLHIYGEGVLRLELEQQIQALGLQDKVFLEGNSSQVHEDIKNAKLFVFTSDYEGLPNALLEAIALGIPCISTDCSPGGAKMLIDHGENGVLIPCGDVDTLCEAMDELLSNEEKLKKFSMNGKKIREKVSIETISKEWLTCIDQVKKK